MRYATRSATYHREYLRARSRGAGDLDRSRPDRASLDANDRWRMMCSSFNRVRCGLSAGAVDVTKVPRSTIFSGFHNFYPSFSSGSGGAPSRRRRLDNALTATQVTSCCSMAIGRFKEGEEAACSAKLTIRRDEQFDTSEAADRGDRLLSAVKNSGRRQRATRHGSPGI